MASASELEARRRKNEEELNFYSTQISVETLEIVRRRLAKRSNQRMVRLERSVSKISGEAYHIGAYDMAQEYLREQKNTDKKNLRFSEKLSQRNAEDFESETEYRQYLLNEVAHLQSFLTGKSSTTRGNREIEAKRVETFKNAGISEAVATSKSFYNFITGAAYKFLDNRIQDSERLQELFDYYTDPEKTREIKVDDFNKILDEYTDWLDEPKNATREIKLKDIADALDAFMIYSKDYDTAELEERLLNRGVYTAEELEELKKGEGDSYKKYFR